MSEVVVLDRAPSFWPPWCEAAASRLTTRGLDDWSRSDNKLLLNSIEGRIIFYDLIIHFYLFFSFKAGVSNTRHFLPSLAACRYIFSIYAALELYFCFKMRISYKFELKTPALNTFFQVHHWFHNSSKPTVGSHPFLLTYPIKEREKIA